MRAFEIFLQESRITSADWKRLIQGIAEYESNFTIEAEFDTNNVEFYLYAKKNLSLLTTKIEGFILKPINRKQTNIENKFLYKRINFKLSSKNILEHREIEEIKKQRIIHKVFINFRKILIINIYSVTVLLKDDKKGNVYSSYYSITNPLQSFEFDFSNNMKIKKKSVPLYLKIDDIVKLFTSTVNEAFLEVFGFPHFSNPTYFPLNKFEFGKHSLIVGQTGVGKSKFIELFVKNIAKHSQPNEYVVVIVDPHASLYSQFLTIDESKTNFDFTHSSCDLFPPFSEPKIATELTILLFKTLLKDQFNAKMERVLKYTIYVLFLQNQMSLATLQKFLSELEFRKKF